MKKLLEITVRGHSKEWGFEFFADPKYLAEWREDGLEVDEICNTIPLWLPTGLTRVWCIAQDILHFNWRRKRDVVS